MKMGKTYRPLRDRLDLPPHKPLQLIRTLGIRRRLVIIAPTIIEYQLGITQELHWRRILVPA